MKFDAVILAGGKSSRMGLDKAFLEFEGQALLTRQVQLAREAGASEVFLSGRTGVEYSQFGCRIVHDRAQDAGPLAGIEAGLTISSAPLVLVLAVDMAWMNARSLGGLMAQCMEDRGVVPLVCGEIEPLAAIYPRAARPLVQSIISSNHSRSARRFATRCVEAGLASFQNIPESEAGRFVSCNTFAEFQRLSGGKILVEH